MNIFGLNIQISRNQNSKIQNQKSLSSEALAWLGDSPEDIGRPGSVLINAYEQVVWVYRAINVMAEQVANIPFLFSAGERGRETLITYRERENRTRAFLMLRFVLTPTLSPQERDKKARSQGRNDSVGRRLHSR